MTHPDHETRVGAHSIFSMVLMPSALSPWLDTKMKLSGDVSGLSVSTLQDVSYGRFSSEDNGKDSAETIDGEERNQLSDFYTEQSWQSYAFWGALVGGKTVWELNKHKPYNYEWLFLLIFFLNWREISCHVDQNVNLLKLPGANFASAEQSPSESVAFINLGSGNICWKYSCKFWSNGPHL